MFTRRQGGRPVAFAVVCPLTLTASACGEHESEHCVGLYRVTVNCVRVDDHEGAATDSWQIFCARMGGGGLGSARMPLTSAGYGVNACHRPQNAKVNQTKVSRFGKCTSQVTSPLSWFSQLGRVSAIACEYRARCAHERASAQKGSVERKRKLTVHVAAEALPSPHEAPSRQVAPVFPRRVFPRPLLRKQSRWFCRRDLSFAKDRLKGQGSPVLSLIRQQRVSSFFFFWRGCRRRAAAKAATPETAEHVSEEQGDPYRRAHYAAAAAAADYPNPFGGAATVFLACHFRCWLCPSLERHEQEDTGRHGGGCRDPID